MKTTIRLFVLTVLLCGSIRPGFTQLIASAQLQPRSVVSQPSVKTLKDVLQEFKTHYHVDILYFDHLVEGYRVSADAVKLDPNVEQSLTDLLKPLGLKYKKTNNGGYVITKAKNSEKKEQKSLVPEEVHLIRNDFGQGNYAGSMSALKGDQLLQKMNFADKTITGRITDAEKREGLPGVNVLVKGTTNGTVTDANGGYSISIPDGPVSLVFSFIGFVSQEIAITSQSVVDIALVADIQSLSEVVVTGYSSERKKDITGSVAVVDMKALKSIPGGSAVRALQGQASGVNVISSGVPGGASTINIRGISSFGNTQPLVMVDGVEANLNEISSTDIESIQVLKDAGAAAIYGVRGSNGVIIVTTKKGKTGAPKISYDTYFGQQVPLKGNVFDMLNPTDFARLSKIAFPSSVLFKDGLPDYLYSGPGVSGTGKEGDAVVSPSKYLLDPSNPANNYLIQKVNKEGTDWFHEIFKSAPIQEHNLSISGATDKAGYLVALGYLNQQGTLIETFHKRVSARVNTNFKIGKNIRVGENLYLYSTKNPGFANQAENNSISHVYRQMTLLPVYDIGGNFGGMFAGPDLGNASNPVAIQKRTANNRGNTWNIVGNAYAEVDFLKNFTVRTSIGGSINNRYNITFDYNRYNDREGNTSLNSLSEASGYSTNTIWTNTLNYNNRFGKHYVKVLLGSEAILNYSRTLNGSRSDYFSTDFDYLVLGNGTSNLNNSSSASENTLYSMFARVDYAFSDKYLLGATIRRDGSSRFGSEKRYGVFPSFSLGWRLSDEAFMKDINWLNDLKIKGSYGVLGSQNNVDPANAFTLFGSGIGTSYYDITGSNTSAKPGFYQTRNGNRNTSWEKNIVSNFGLDASILNNRLEFSLEYYKKSINGLLFPLPLAATAGAAAAPTVNIGDIQNTGFDLSGTYRGKISDDFLFTIGANITTYQNEVVSTPDPGYFDTADSRNGNLVRNQIGHPVSSFFGYQVMGLFKNEAEVTSSPTQTAAAPGRFRYQDIDGDGAITAADRTFTGNPNPDFTYGLNLGFNYKGFDFSSIFYGSQGNEVFNLVRYYTHFYSGFRGGKSNVLLNAWTPENTDTTVPVIEAAGNFSTSSVPNSYYIENGSFLKLRSLILGYTVPSGILQKIKANNLRLYVQASNLFTITKYTGLDPELMGESSAFGIDRGNYPNNQKTFLVGLNISF
ncbi:SusC/RagA family TonB-linked outer membrane protein [Dyadobacter sp. CY323]|uniref:SusC/RagA family TonB-linked outer membrane protein n=1 Tax=Dyadobacter sp. CY323 TaxID=2907302 RepID=UPI001F1DB786|nr:SusC/RagA family TonB-linked outer membrane protein [Dyadobacter sp. CY323]MCE6990156.1 SusC/RagA family TonB-linked outer membrane protein [Dyadobacter sp. CY323]